MPISPGLPPAEQVELNDHDLVARFVSGDESAFEALVNRHSRMVYSTCLRIVRDRSAAEDALQSVFIILARKAPTLSPPTVIGGWLYLTARTCALKMRQQREIRQIHERQQELPPSTSEEPSEWQDVKPLIDQALATLPSVQREAIVTHYLGQKSLADTARILDCPIETVHTRLTRGMARLRKHCRTLSVAALGGLLTGLSSAELPTAVAQQTVATALGHLTPTPSVSALTASVISQGATRSFVGIAAASALVVTAGISLWLWLAGSEKNKPVAPQITAEKQSVSTPSSGTDKNAPVAPQPTVQPEPELPDPLSGWRFVNLPASAATLTRDGKTARVMRIGQLALVEPFGRAIRPLITGDGGFICQYDWKLESKFAFPRLFFSQTVDAELVDWTFRRRDFRDEDYTQNRNDHQWYHTHIRCEPVPQGWQITEGDGGITPDRVRVTPTIPEFFVIHVFNGILDIDRWSCKPLTKAANREL